MPNHPLNTAQLAEAFVSAHGGNLQTAQRYIRAEIKRGNLPAIKLGDHPTSPYLIEPAAAAQWLAKPNRGTRTKNS